MSETIRTTICAAVALLWAPLPAGAGPRPTTTAPAGCRPPGAEQARRSYRWARRNPGYEALACRIPAPAGYTRVPAAAASWAHWLRHLPLLPAESPVRSFKDEVVLEADNPHLAAVVDLDLSRRDRQQCADTIMRLRGEYLYAAGRPGKTRFRWAGGMRFGYDQWRRGLRPTRQGQRWVASASARPSRGYRSFRRYLEFIFSWTGTVHMVGEPKVKPQAIQPGDFLIQAGSPGHAVVILDLAKSDDGKKLKVLLGQGFIPAQDLHILRGDDRSPWFSLERSRPLKTPFWRPFAWSDLRRFRH